MAQENIGFGTAPYQGFEYQILATVYVALNLIIERKQAVSLVVEPAGGEDIAAELRTDPEAATSTVNLTIETHALQIQIKSKHSGHWTEAPFRDVLSREPEKQNSSSKRIRPIEFLQSTPNGIFVFLTDGPVNEDLEDFKIQNFGDRSSAVQLPKQCPGTPDLASRIGILQLLTVELLNHRIAKILQTDAHVPSRSIVNCIKDLKEAVRERLLALRAQNWPQNEIQEILKSHGGLPNGFVGSRIIQPVNYVSLVNKIATNHALLISGTPGSGKSTVAESIVFDMRMRGYDEIRVNPANLESIAKFLHDPHETIFYIEDPWGQYRVESYSSYWINELPKLLAQKTHKKLFLITSRTGIVKSAFGSAPPAIVLASESSVTENSYDETRLNQILDLHSNTLSPNERDYIARHRSTILKEIRNPYELSMLVNLVRKSPGDIIDRYIHNSKIQFIGNTLAQEVRSGGQRSVNSAVVLWLQFMLGNVSESALNDLRTYAIQGGVAPGEIDPRGLLRTLVASGWFKKRNEHFVAHPTQIAGLESLIREPSFETPTEDVLNSILSGMTTTGKVLNATFVSRQLVSRQFPIPPSVQTAIDRFVVSKCVQAGQEEFRSAVNDVNDLSRGIDPVSLLVKALESRSADNEEWMISEWKTPQWDEQTVSQVRTSEDAKAVAKKYFKYLMPTHTSLRYTKKTLIKFIFDTLGWDFSGECESGFRDALNYGNADFDSLLYGALRQNPVPFDRLLNEVLERLSDVQTSSQNPNDRYEKAVQAELDAIESDYLIDQPGDEFFAPTHAMDILVKERIRLEGYDWILRHPRLKDLIHAWKNSFGKKTEPSEIQSFLVCCEDNLTLALRGIRETRAIGAKDWIISKLQRSSEIIEEGVDALRELLSFRELITSLTRGFSLDMRIALAKFVCNRAGESEKLQALDAMFLESERDVSKAILFKDDPWEVAKTLPLDMLDYLSKSEIDYVALPSIAFLAILDIAKTEELRKFITMEDPQIRAWAVGLCGLPVFQSLTSQIRPLLKDKHYKVRRATLNSLAEHARNDEWSELFALSKDPSGPVREACAEIICKKARLAGLPTLISMLDDQRNSNSHTGMVRDDIGGGPIYRVARTAASGLRRFDKISPEAAFSIEAFLKAGTSRCEDVVVRYELTNSLSGYLNPRVPELLIGLLEDSQYAGGTKNAGYPVRYAAAWGLVYQLTEQVDGDQSIRAEAFFESARHTDGRLAGPCLICLGMLGSKAAVELRNILPEMSPTNRHALLPIGAALAKMEYSNLTKQIPALGVLLKKFLENPPLNSEGFEQWLATQPEVKNWIDGINKDNDVGNAIKKGLTILCPAFSKKGPSDYDDDHLPEVIGTITTRIMAGFE